MTLLISHLLAAFTILVAPWLGRVWYQRALKRMQAADSSAKTRLYRTIVIDQVVTTAVILGLWLYGGIPSVRLGLSAPRSWWLSAGLTLLLSLLLVWSGIRLRRKGEKIREKLRGAEALLPDTPVERRWFAAVSIGAGIAEELTFRGFLFYYFSLWFPHINGLENALLTSLIFGLGHLYQGLKGIVSTGLAGLIMAGLYLLSGNLLLPMVVHAIGDLRVLLIFSPRAAPETTAPAAA